MDPCVRITTNPAPVFAPQRELQTAVDLLIESAINEEILSIQGLVENKEGGFTECCDKDVSKQTLDVTSTSGGNSNKREGHAENTSGEGGRDKMLTSDLYLSDEGATSLQESKSPVKKIDTIKPAHGKTPKSHVLKTKIKSSEYVELSSSESEEESKSAKKKIKLISPLPLKKKFEHVFIGGSGKVQCRHVLLRGDKKGLRCTSSINAGFGDLCDKHVRKTNAGKVKLQEKVESMEREWIDLKKKLLDYEKTTLSQKRCIFTNRQKILALEKETEQLKNTIRGYEVNAQEMQNKLDTVLNKRPEQNTPSKNIDVPRRKITKLDKGKTYKLVKFEGSEAVLQHKDEQFRLILPSHMHRPGTEGKWSLTFNSHSNKFEWLQL